MTGKSSEWATSPCVLTDVEWTRTLCHGTPPVVPLWSLSSGAIKCDSLCSGAYFGWSLLFVVETWGPLKSTGSLSMGKIYGSLWLWASRVSVRTLMMNSGGSPLGPSGGVT